MRLSYPLRNGGEQGVYIPTPDGRTPPRGITSLGSASLSLKGVAPRALGQRAEQLCSALLRTEGLSEPRYSMPTWGEFEERAEGMKQSLLGTGKQPSWAAPNTQLWYPTAHFQ